MDDGDTTEFEPRHEPRRPNSNTRYNTGHNTGHNTGYNTGYNKGRGALSNPGNRYARHSIADFDDGWWRAEDIRSIATEVIEERVRTIITTNQSPDIPFDQSINPYRGCEHGCIYCYARPSHAYWDMSPGLDFETRIVVKPGAADLLRTTLSNPRYQCKTICIGANTDPYQPLEVRLGITRAILEVLQEFSHPFSLITKSALILRDLDIITDMAAKQLCTVAVSVTTLDNDTKRRLEPRAASPASRLRAIRALSDAGVHVSMLVAPVIPMINDVELEDILAAGKEAGASAANYIFLRLPLEIAPMFREWLSEHYPDRAEHVMSLVRQSRGGRDYRSEFHTRMSAEGVFADLIRKRFNVAAKKLGFESDRRFVLDTSRFKRVNEQLSLF